jgi:hypothetical protein
MLLFVSVAFLSTMRAVTPAPDGGYPNHNTAEGDLALQSLIPASGFGNTAVGTGALYNTTTGRTNTAVGDSALGDNDTGSNNTVVGSNALLQNKASGNTAIGAAALQ